MSGRFDAWVERARTVPIERVIEQRGIRLNGRTDREGPCPRCGGTNRFSINLRKQCWNCRQCKPNDITGNVIGLVQWLDDCDFREACAILAGQTPNAGIGKPRYVAERQPADYERRQHEKASWLWRRRRPIEGTPAERYLRHVRAYRGPFPPNLAFLAPTKPKHHPAMIAAFGIPTESQPGVLDDLRGVDAVHFTLLRADGSDKADVAKPQFILGSPGRLPIVIAPPNDLLGLAVTEGIEDGLSVYQCTGLGVWVAGSAGMMPALARSIPGCIETVTIFGHADKNGQNGARKLAAALVRRGIEVRLEGMPP
jgi:putative DNA primase/helicase